ncbi:galactokinase [Paenibacillus sp. 1001270B_150601_E10]|uniref:galactokinase n=1 Tax=Paenibacillus sp. 1001270B_150601_E10 TaxID=2787079 RepID=UPI00189FAD3D|nr:galactokinase [Paenibacillus sp. 1001270B_150601_E10]
MDHMQWQEEFEKRMGKSSEGVRFFHAPGRVNLIGEHIDYNGGLVLPAALHIGTTLMIRRRQDRLVRLASMQFPEVGEASVDALPEAKANVWTDYVYGVMQEMKKDHKPVKNGYDILITGNIPNGSGLSSSASLEVVSGYALMTMEGYEIDRTALAVLSQRAENGFVGVNSGIMDQFAVSQGKKDHAILLNCDTLEYEHVPFHIQGYKLVIGNTKKRRGLVDSKYNERRAQCEEALAALQIVHPTLEYLAHLSPEAFEQSKQVITDETVRQRAEHVVYENERVKQSMIALSQGELTEFGSLMNASHVSLRDLYEVSCTELDVMVEEALHVQGTIGSRMTGAGFGGCTVSLVQEDAVEAFIEAVGTRYEARTGIIPEFYVCEVGDGVQECLIETSTSEV